MKKTIIALAIACMAVATATAQESKDKKQQPDQNRRTEQMAQAMANRMMLDDNARAKFTPLYKEYMEALKAVRPERNAGAKRGAELTDKEIEESIEKNFETRQKRLDVEKTYYKKFKSVLNARQLKQLFGRNNTQRLGVKPANLRSNKIGTAAMARLRPAKKVHPAKAVTANGSAAQAPTK